MWNYGPLKCVYGPLKSVYGPVTSQWLLLLSYTVWKTAAPASSLYTNTSKATQLSNANRELFRVWKMMDFTGNRKLRIVIGGFI